MEKSISKTQSTNNYHSREVVSNACSEIFENILRKTYDEENPFKDGSDILSPRKSTNEVSDSNSSSTCDISTIQNRYVCPKANEAKTNLDSCSDSCKTTTKSKYTTASSGITQVHYFNQTIANPFENLINTSSSFTCCYKPHMNKRPKSAILEEGESDYEDLEDLASVSAEKITHSRGIQKEETHREVVSEAVGNYEREIVIRRDSSMHNQINNRVMLAQGDNNAVNDFERPLFDNPGGSISIKINFAFYAKLLAFLLTINTLMFFKTFVLSNLFNFLIK